MNTRWWDHLGGAWSVVGEGGVDGGCFGGGGEMVVAAV